MVKVLVGLIVLVMLLGGGLYWYSMQSDRAESRLVATDDFFDKDALPQAPAPAENPTPNAIPPGAVMETGTIPDSAMISPTTAPAASGPTREITISTGPNFTFNPKEITVQKGERVKITLKNTRGTHDWRLDGYGVGTKIIQGGQSDTVEFVADKAGEFEYYCSVGNHRQIGMWGILTVAE